VSAWAGRADRSSCGLQRLPRGLPESLLSPRLLPRRLLPRPSRRRRCRCLVEPTTRLHHRRHQPQSSPPPHLAVDLDQPLHQDGLHLLAGERIPGVGGRRTGGSASAGLPPRRCSTRGMLLRQRPRPVRAAAARRVRRPSRWPPARGLTSGGCAAPAAGAGTPAACGGRGRAWAPGGGASRGRGGCAVRRRASTALAVPDAKQQLPPRGAPSSAWRRCQRLPPSVSRLRGLPPPSPFPTRPGPLPAAAGQLTKMPPSLSSIQWLGAFSRFMCFLGPRTMVAPAARAGEARRGGGVGASVG
jgi:hypothetical protein